MLESKSGSASSRPDNAATDALNQAVADFSRPDNFDLIDSFHFDIYFSSSGGGGGGGSGTCGGGFCGGTVGGGVMMITLMGYSQASNAGPSCKWRLIGCLGRGRFALSPTQPKA